MKTNAGGFSMNRRRFATSVFGSAIFCMSLARAGYPQTFYEGKTITIIQGRGPGGTGDLRVKAVIPFLKKYLPGQATIVSEYMTGGGGTKAANHIYRNAPRDGLTIGNVGGGLVPNAIFGESGVLYEIDKLIFLGSTNGAQHYVFYTHRAAALNSLEKLRAAAQVRIGAPSVGGELYTMGRIFAYFLGLKDPRFVLGYNPAELDLAIEQREIDARAQTVAPLLRQKSHWIQKGMLDFHAIVEIPKGLRHPKFGRLPELESFANSNKERQLLTLFRNVRLFGTSYFLPPGVPEDRAKILQDAFTKAFRDPEFEKEFKKLTGEEAEALTVGEMKKALSEIPRDAEVISFFKKFAGPDPLPRR
jgi:tripartite-type tricarboxylate transporter receptor subunit TctC